MLTPPSPYQLRPLQLVDVPEVRAIEQVSLPTPAKLGTYEYELTQNELAYYQALLVNGRCLIGYSGYWLIADEAHISIIAVHPEWRRHGLGELLLLNMLTLIQAQAATLATLEVRAGNTAAQALYKKHDFAIVGERSGYYRDGETALIMSVELPVPDLDQKCLTLFARLQSETPQLPKCI
jgi:ribosomal-protein-alanine N-acetyltransferase